MSTPLSSTVLVLAACLEVGGDALRMRERAELAVLVGGALIVASGLVIQLAGTR